MKKIPFILLSESDGSPVVGASENIIVRINKDGEGFNTATNAAEEFSPGYYSIELTDSELKCEQFVVVEISCTGAQQRVFSYTPEGIEADAQAIASAVWKHRIRKLTTEVTEIIEPNAEGDNLELRVIE